MYLINVLCVEFVSRALTRYAITLASVPAVSNLIQPYASLRTVGQGDNFVGQGDHLGS